MLQAQLFLAQAYYGHKNFDEAIAVYRHLAELFPNNPEIPLRMGDFLVRLNRRAEARQAFEKSLQLSPGYLPAVEWLVDLSLPEKNYAQALDLVKKQLERSPTNAVLWLLEAKVHMAQAAGYVILAGSKTPAGRPKPKIDDVPAAKPLLDQTEAALKKALELDSNLREGYLELAHFYVDCGKQRQALDELTGLVAKTNIIRAFMMIGQIHDALKEYPDACDAYEKLLSIQPNYTDALNNLAYDYSEYLNQPDKAYKRAERARELSPFDPYTADTLGWVLFKRAEYGRAAGLLQESAFRMPSKPEIQFHLGMAHYMLGEEVSRSRRPRAGSPDRYRICRKGGSPAPLGSTPDRRKIGRWSGSGHYRENAA